MEKLNEITKDELIKKNFRKLNRIFKFLDKDRRLVAEKLCRKAAFMDVTLDEMQRQITAEGYIITATNGNGFEVRTDHPAMKTYNTMIKNYTAVIKQLAELLPEAPEAADDIISFMRSKTQ